MLSNCIALTAWVNIIITHISGRQMWQVPDAIKFKIILEERLGTYTC